MISIKQFVLHLLSTITDKNRYLRGNCYLIYDQIVLSWYDTGKPEIIGDKLMDGKLLSDPSDDKHNFSFCRLKLFAITSGHST